jgi:hypothetical protein
MTSLGYTGQGEETKAINKGKLKRKGKEARKREETEGKSHLPAF